MEPFELTVSQATRMIASGELSPLTLMESLLERIQQMEPLLKAWVTLDREAAMDAAQASERDLLRSGPRGLLHGIPVGIKDIFYTAGVKTTACSDLYADFMPTYDATCVAKLKAEGIIVLGKTVTTPYAASDPSPTVNPWNPEHTPGGSSSGSSVAVAARMCPVALGSQTVGSTLRPAAYNGIVGLKPTYGRISIVGVMPLGWSLDTVGILARSTEDAALLLQAMAGHDPYDPASSTEPVPDYRKGLDLLDRPPHIGLVRDFFYERAHKEVQAHTDAIAQLLSEAGAVIHEMNLPASFIDNEAAGNVTFKVEAAAVHEVEFRAGPHRYPPLIRAMIEEGMEISAVEYARAQRTRAEFRRDIKETLGKVDVLLTPSTPTSAPRDLATTGEKHFQGPWTTAGLPCISLPSGLDSSGLPLGIQLVGTWYAEARLLAVANWCEAALGPVPAPPV
ncbi:MAG: amidase, partial [Chloroflexi bacterium]|nr:amidase [Chloroflexota bacterium]